MPIERPQGETFFQGVGVSPGIAIGPVYLAEKGMARIPEYSIAVGDVTLESERFDEAVTQSQKQLRTLQGKASALSGAVGEEFGYLLEAHIQMLTGSRLVRNVSDIIKNNLINAEAAVQLSLNQIALDFAQIDDPYLSARMEDVREVGSRLIRNLIKVSFSGFEHVAQGSIIIGEDISPADVALMEPTRIRGFSAALGGAEGHTAIMARSLGLPAVLGLANIVQLARSGDIVVVDGMAGLVILNPSPETIATYRGLQHRHSEELVALAALRDLPAVTGDGLEIALEANIELPAEIAAALNSGATGIGLLRSEFMFMNRETLPDEEEQFQILKAVIEGMKGAPVTIRTLDVGGDKLAYSLGAHLGDSNNPALGLRAIRLSLKVPALFEAQICAILRVAAYGPVRILLPMITTPAEVLEVRAIIGKMEKQLRARGVNLAKTTPPVGIMIEIPAAALSADSLARVSDFFSIGTNDLTMYTLAIDRGNEQVAHLYDSLNPAVLRLLQFSTEAARRAGIPVNLCGEMAGEEKFAAFLVGLGLRNLSMAATSLPRIKRRIRQLDGAEARRLAEHIMSQYDRREIAASLDSFNRDFELS